MEPSLRVSALILAAFAVPAACGGVSDDSLLGREPEGNWGSGYSSSSGAGSSSGHASSGGNASSSGGNTSSSGNVSSSGGNASSSGGGTSSGGNASSSSGGSSVDPLAAARTLCLDTINELRATESLEPYTYWQGEGINECADRQAKLDEQNGTPHGTWRSADAGSCKGGGQNECLGAGVNGIVGCLNRMWSEKDLPACAGCAECPRGNCPDCVFNTCGHYLNMHSASFSQVVCGFNAGGGWAVQNFR